MFMFVFAVVLIALVSLFFQVIVALGALIGAGDVAMAQQMSIWHSMAYRYSCSAAGRVLVANATDAPIYMNDTPAYLNGIKAQQNPGGAVTYKGYAFRTTIFRGQIWDTVTGTALSGNVRLVATFVLPPSTTLETDNPGGLTSTQIAKQFRRLDARGGVLYSFGLANNHRTRFVTYDRAPTGAIQNSYKEIRNLPSTPKDIRDTTLVIVSDASC